MERGQKSWGTSLLKVRGKYHGLVHTFTTEITDT